MQTRSKNNANANNANNANSKNSNKNKPLKPTKIGEGAFGSIVVSARDPRVVIKTIEQIDFELEGVSYSTLREIAACNLLHLGAKLQLYTPAEANRIVKLSEIQVDDIGDVLFTMRRERCDLKKYVADTSRTARHALAASIKNRSTAANRSGAGSGTSGISENSAQTHLLSLEQCKDIMYQVAMALRICHLLNIAHRDLKPENILLCNDNSANSDSGVANANANANGNGITVSRNSQQSQTSLQIVLADFGFARLVPSEVLSSAPISTSTGLLYDVNEFEHKVHQKYDQYSDVFSPGNYMCTLGFRPPELLSNTKRYSALAVDIWSWGVMLWSLLMGTFPAELCDEIERVRIVFQKIFQNAPAPFGEAESVPLGGKTLSKLETQFMSWSETEFKTRLHGPELDKLDKRMWIDKMEQMYGSETVDILTRALQYRPEQRATVEELLMHPAFANQRAKFGIFVPNGRLDNQQLQLDKLLVLDQLSRVSSIAHTFTKKTKETSNLRKHKMRRAHGKNSKSEIQSSKAIKKQQDEKLLDGHDIKIIKSIAKEYNLKTYSQWALCAIELLRHHHNKIEAYHYALRILKMFVAHLSTLALGHKSCTLPEIDELVGLGSRSLMLLTIMACCRLGTKLCMSSMHIHSIRDYLVDNAFIKALAGSEYRQFDPQWIFEMEIWICKSLQWNLALPNSATLCSVINSALGIANFETQYPYECLVHEYDNTSETRVTHVVGSSRDSTSDDTGDTTKRLNHKSDALEFHGAPLAAEHELLIACLCDYELSQLPPSIVALTCIDVCHNPLHKSNRPDSMQTHSSRSTANIPNLINDIKNLLRTSDDEYKHVFAAVTRIKHAIPQYMQSKAWQPFAQLVLNW